MSRYQNHPIDPDTRPLTQEEQDSFCGWCGSVTCSTDPCGHELQLQVADITQTIEMLSGLYGILNARITELEN